MTGRIDKCACMKVTLHVRRESIDWYYTCRRWRTQSAESSGDKELGRTESVRQRERSEKEREEGGKER